MIKLKKERTLDSFYLLPAAGSEPQRADHDLITVLMILYMIKMNDLIFEQYLTNIL